MERGVLTYKGQTYYIDIKDINVEALYSHHNDLFLDCDRRIAITGWLVDKTKSDVQVSFTNNIKIDAEAAKRQLNAWYGLGIYENRRNRNPKIKKVIFNNPATIVFWSDGTKTVVKFTPEIKREEVLPGVTFENIYDEFDPEKGLAMAIAKKFLGNKWSYYNIFKKWLPKED